MIQSDTFWTASIFSVGAGITFGSVLITLIGFVVIGVVQPFFRVYWTKLLSKKPKDKIIYRYKKRKNRTKKR